MIHSPGTPLGLELKTLNCVGPLCDGETRSAPAGHIRADASGQGDSRMNTIALASPAHAWCDSHRALVCAAPTCKGGQRRATAVPRVHRVSKDWGDL